MLRSVKLENTVVRVEVGLADVDEQIVAPGPELRRALVNPDGLHVGAERTRQSTDDLAVFQGLHLGKS